MDTNFEKLYPGDATFDKSSRVVKAKKVVAVISDYKKDTSKLTALDYGCSVGLMTEYFGEKFKKVYGVDVDEYAVSIAVKRNKNKSVVFKVSKSEKLDFKDNSFDVVIFNQIYEHVKNPQRSLNEIQRVLKPGGVCYFGARNKYFPMDGHYPIPFLAIIPRSLAHFLMRTLLRKKDYDIKLHSLWELRKLARSFEVKDYTIKAFQNPRKYYLNENLKWFSPFAYPLYFLIPNYIWLLVKK